MYGQITSEVSTGLPSEHTYLIGSSHLRVRDKAMQGKARHSTPTKPKRSDLTAGNREQSRKEKGDRHALDMVHRYGYIDSSDR